MTTSKGLGISIKHGDHSREMELRVNQHALGVRVPQGDNLRLALLRTGNPEAMDQAGRR
jgi:hypothetical protein